MIASSVITLQNQFNMVIQQMSRLEIQEMLRI